MEGIEGPPGLGKRKDRESGEPVDVDEDDELVPTEMAGPTAQLAQAQGPRRELTLQDILDAMNTGFATQNNNTAEMRREMGELQRDTQEAKTLSAKAVTIATETKDSLTTLEQRVAAIEAGHPMHPAGRSHARPPTKPPPPGILTCWVEPHPTTPLRTPAGSHLRGHSPHLSMSDCDCQNQARPQGYQGDPDADARLGKEIPGPRNPAPVGG